MYELSELSYSIVKGFCHGSKALLAVKALKSTKDGGIVPDKVLFARSRKRRAGSFVISTGMRPEKELDLNPRITKRGNSLLIQSGNFPLKLLWDRSRTVRFLQIRRNKGNSPERLLSLRRRD